MVLKLLAPYYLAQGLLLAAVGAGGVLLLDQNHLLVIKQWLHVIHLDPETRFIPWLLTKVLPITDQLLETLSIGSFVYAGLASVQGGAPVRSAMGFLAHGGRDRFIYPMGAVGHAGPGDSSEAHDAGDQWRDRLVSPRERIARQTRQEERLRRRKLPQVSERSQVTVPSTHLHILV